MYKTFMRSASTYQKCNCSPAQVSACTQSLSPSRALVRTGLTAILAFGRLLHHVESGGGSSGHCWKRSLAERKSSQRTVTRYVTCDCLYPVIPDSDRLQIRTDSLSMVSSHSPVFFRFIVFHILLLQY
jgi:hypothetical protein